MREFKIVPIRDGTVIDHIAPGRALEVLRALGLPVDGSRKVISLSMNLPSSRGGFKDVLKLEDMELSAQDIAKVQDASARGTLVVIRNYDVAHKRRWGLD